MSPDHGAGAGKTEADGDWDTQNEHWHPEGHRDTEVGTEIGNREGTGTDRHARQEEIRVK